MHARTRRTLVVTILVGLVAVDVRAAATPEQKCQATKNKTAGKYAACRQGAEAKLASTGDVTKYGETLIKCVTKLTTAWQKADLAAAAASVSCLDAPLTVGAFQAVLDAHTTNVATALQGGGLADYAGDLAACQAEPKGQPAKTGLTACWDTAGTPIACAGTGQDGELQKGLARSYTDNGDGTITDDVTGLMWEKLSDDGSIHDRDTTYTWANAFAVKVATLNATTFAGHGDWRVPNRAELESLLALGLAAPPIAPIFNTGCLAGCTVLTCSCTAANVYWTSTTLTANLGAAWIYIFTTGDAAGGAKTGSFRVRAVRGA